jgi:hypothetical protein
MRAYKLAAFGLAGLALAAIGLFATLAPPACAQGRNLPTPPPCDCSHLSNLQAELRNARLLEQRHRAEAERLRNMSSEQATTAYAEFLMSSSKGLECVPGGDKISIDYELAGDLKSWEDRTSGRYTHAQLCARSQNSENDLKIGVARAGCRGIGDTLRAHEDFHVETCERMGYPAHFFMHRSELATDEAEAYGRHAASLGAIIVRILEEAEPRVLFFSEQNIGGVNLEILNGETRPIDVMPIGSGEFLLRGSGELSTTVMRTQPGCWVASGSSYKQPLSTYLTTDGLTAWVRAHVTPVEHEIGYQCSDGGGGRFTDLRMSWLPDVSLKLEDGASVPFNVSSPIPGSGRVTLRICRPSAP